MMKLRKLIVCCLAFATLLCLGIATSLNVNYSFVKAESFNIQDELPEVKKSYFKGDVIKNLPTTLTVEYYGKDYLVKDAIVLFPNGVSYKVEEGKDISLSIAGTYTLKYFYSDSSISFVAEKLFVVSNNYYDMIGSGGNYRITDDNVKLEAKKNAEGIILDLDPSSEFIFNKVINVYDNTVNGEKELISLSPRNVYVYDDDVKDIGSAVAKVKSKFIYVRITDCYDATNYIEYRLYRAPQWGAPVYISVGTSRLPYTAIVPYDSRIGSGKQAVYEGSSVWVMQDSIYGIGGYPGICAGAGHASNSGLINQKSDIVLKFNPTTNEVFANSFSKNSKITELDSLDVYGTTNANKLFTGFTTGEVVLSITAGDFSDKISNAEIYSIDGISGADLTALASAEYKDTQKPVIDIDCYKTNDTGLNASLGQIVTIPQAKAYDVNLTGDVKFYVKDSLGHDVSIINGNQFVCQNPTTYTIYYEAVDLFGNKSELTTLTVSVNALINNYSIGIGDNLRQEFLDIEKVSDSSNNGKLLAGKKYTLPEVDFKTLNKDLKFNCKVVGDNETIVLGDDLSFIPKYEGTYKVIYSFTDNVFTHTLEYTVDCTPSNLVAFTTTPAINRYIIKNQKYYLNIAKATTFTNGIPEFQNSNVYIVYLDSDKEVIGEPVAVPDYTKCEFLAPENAKFVKVRYEKNGEFIETNVAKVIDVAYNPDTINGYEMRKYFDYEDTFECNTTYFDPNYQIYRPLSAVKYVSKINEGSNTLSFVNQVVLKKFAFQYKIDTSEANYTGVEFKFTDVNDSSKVVVILIQKEGSNTYAYVNGENRTLLSGTKFSGADVNLYYEQYYRRLTIGNTKITIDLGYVSYCDLDISLLGITGKSSFQVNMIANQPLDNVEKEDYYAPYGYQEYMMGEYSLGEVVEIVPGQYFDVLRQLDYSKYEMSIRFEDPDVVLTDIDGNPVNKITDPNKSVKIQLNNYGEYYVTTKVYQYDSYDKNSARSETYTFKCIDKEAPTIILGNNYNENTVVKIKAGQKINVYYTVLDNKDDPSDINIVIQLMEKNHAYNVHFKSGETSMYLRHKGTFDLIIAAQDKAGNFSTKKYTIISE